MPNLTRVEHIERLDLFLLLEEGTMFQLDERLVKRFLSDARTILTSMQHSPFWIFLKDSPEIIRLQVDLTDLEKMTGGDDVES
jgi:hypothetical protein